MKSNANVTDKIESMILLALDAKHKAVKTTDNSVRVSDTGDIWEKVDQGTMFLKTDEMIPESAFTFDMADKDRIFAGSKDGLLDHAAEIIGDQTEIAMLMPSGSLKWLGFRRMARKPKGLAYLGKASHFYEYHFRLVHQNGQGAYIKRIVVLNHKGDVLPAKIGGEFLCSPSQEGTSFYIAASMVEDAHRANTMLAAVKDATELKFSVPLDDYKAMFSGREAPMAGARRKAIIHWVAKHLRRSHAGNPYEVKRHVRGVDEITIDGLRIHITPNA